MGVVQELQRQAADLPDAADLEKIFAELQLAASQEDRSILEISSVVALGAVRTGVKLGNVHIFDYYRGALRTIVEEGLLTFLRRTSTPYLTRRVPISIRGPAPTPNACYGAGRTGARPWDARRRSRLKHRMRKMLPVADAKGTSFYLILNPAAGSAVGWPRTSWVLDDRARWRGREDQNSEDHGG